MKRNFGSLNLAALDLNSSFSTSADITDCSLEDQFSAMDPNADDHGMDAGSEYSSDENVGFPLEGIQVSSTDAHSARQSLRSEDPQDVDTEDSLPELSLPARSQSATRSHSVDSDMRSSELLRSSSSEIPQHMHDQHNVELNALRCLSLKVMLSNLSTSSNGSSSTTNSANAPNKPNYAYPGVNNHAKTALLPIRHPSLQSV